jgi:hypothetical protein
VYDWLCYFLVRLRLLVAKVPPSTREVADAV